MAESRRELITEAFLAVLDTIAPPSYLTTVDTVTRWRLPFSVQKDNTVLIVKQGEERADRDTSSFGKLNRTMQLLVIVQIRHDPAQDNLATDTVLNRMEQDIYHAISADPTLGGLAMDVEYIASSQADIPDGEDMMVQQVLEYQVHYRHREGDETQT